MTSKWCDLNLKPIGPFRDEYHFLSMFYPCKIKVGEHMFASGEHMFQAAKTITHDDFLAIKNADTAKEAKRISKIIHVRSDWHDIRNDIMYTVISFKFIQNPALLKSLLDTKKHPLIEYNWWHDNYWGHCICNKCKNKEHKNTLGKLLMEFRYSIRDDLWYL